MTLGHKRARTAPGQRTAPDRLMRFSYGSRLATSAEPQVLRAIGHSTWMNNQRFRITGFLSYVDGRFRQVIEGEPESVAIISASILADKRHHTISLSVFEEVDERMFSDWQLVGFAGVMPQTAETAARPEAVADDRRVASLHSASRRQLRD